MILLGAILLPVAIIWALPLIADAYSLAIRLIVGRAKDASCPGETPFARLVFLVPAHDEALLVEAAVRSLTNQASERSISRIYVIADNCSDETAQCARRAGAIVLERHDPARLGKPAAIAWALPQMPLNDFDAIVIVDADTVVDPGFADALALRAPLHGKAVQALYGTSNPFDSWLTRLASLFEDVRYRGQFPLKRSTGLNVPLTGNGMLLGRDLLTRHGWATDSLTEDLELYARYTAAGEEVDFAPGAILYAQEARDLHQSRVQRRRWQAGRWQVLGRNALPLLCSSRIGVHQKVDALSELVFPGPVTHAAVALTAGFLSLHSNILVRLVGALFAVSAVPTVGWTVWALARRPDRLSLVVDLLWLPFYAAWRLWTAVTALARAHGKSWERSPRHRP